MGRPPLPQGQKLTEQVHIRCTAAEKTSYRAKAGPEGLSQWFKRLAERESA